MSTPSVVQSAAVEVKPAGTVATSNPRDHSVRTVAPQAEGGESYRTLRLLKEWPVVMCIWKSGKQAYESVKHSTKLTETSLGFSEEVVTTLTASTGNIVQKLRPALKLVDNTASEGLERLQKSFPVVKESPDKIYDSVIERLMKLISPAVNTAVSITEVGRRQVKISARTVLKGFRKAMMLVENRLERLDKYIAGTKLQTESSGQASTSQDESPGSGSDASTWAGRLQTAARSALAVAWSASLLCVGACFWLLERLPLVGGFVAEGPASQAASRTPSTASSYSSLSDEPAADEGQLSQPPPQPSHATE